jgi:hypothetical protein
VKHEGLQWFEVKKLQSKVIPLKALAKHEVQVGKARYRVVKKLESKMAPLKRLAKHKVH